jgi:hypothetical protein
MLPKKRFSLFAICLLLFVHYTYGDAKLDYRTQTGAYVAEGKSIRRLSLNRARIKTNKKRKVASFFVLGISGKKTVILPGATAKLSIQTTRPTFYVNAPDAADWQFTLIRLTPKGSHREISEVFMSAIRRDVEKKFDPVAARVRGLSRRLYEITPIGPLSPGEYALAKLPRINPLDTRRVAVESDVWDFRIEARNIKKLR